jgi:hypothetical protein
MNVASSGRQVEAERIKSRLHVNPEFAQKVYDIMAPGTTVIVTDQRVARKPRGSAILEG